VEPVPREAEPQCVGDPCVQLQLGALDGRGVRIDDPPDDIAARDRGLGLLQPLVAHVEASQRPGQSTVEQAALDAGFVVPGRFRIELVDRRRIGDIAARFEALRDRRVDREVFR